MRLYLIGVHQDYHGGFFTVQMDVAYSSECIWVGVVAGDVS